MLDLETTLRVIRAHSNSVSTRFRAHALNPEQTAVNALEYAIFNAVRTKTDVWSDRLNIAALDFWKNIDYYYKFLPPVSTDYTSQYLTAVEDPVPPRSRRRTAPPVHQYLRIELL